MVSEEKKDCYGKYVEFNGSKYRYTKKKDCYGTKNSTGRHLLHRVLWVARHGDIPPKHLIVRVTENPHNFDEGNWKCITRREFSLLEAQKRATSPHILFNGLSYYKRADTPYYFARYTDNDGKNHRCRLHRDVYTHYHGEIPEGYDVHHIDFDPTNNDSTNLVALSRSDHMKLHGDERVASGTWVNPSPRLNLRDNRNAQ